MTELEKAAEAYFLRAWKDNAEEWSPRAAFEAGARWQAERVKFCEHKPGILELLDERDRLARCLEVAVGALTGIERCLGYAPDHVGESYPFALKIIEELRDYAGDTLAKLAAIKAGG